MMHTGKRCGKTIMNHKGLDDMDLNKDQVLQQWVDDFIDTYNREPTKETLELWKYQIYELHFREEEE